MGEFKVTRSILPITRVDIRVWRGWHDKIAIAQDASCTCFFSIRLQVLLTPTIPQTSTMIVFNLSCSHTHQFDGWFRSSDDFDVQRERGLVMCPSCGDPKITKQLSAPRINTGAGAAARPPPSAQAGSGQEVLDASLVPGLQSHMLQQFKSFVLANTVNVGAEFANTARRMHYGEEVHRNIRGRVSADDAIALQEEGIDAVQIPQGILLDEGVQ
jgi:hypothetical protein